MTNQYLLDWLQDKSWGHMMQVITWERTWSESMVSTEVWMTMEQLEDHFKSKEIALKQKASCEKRGTTRPHPDIEDCIEYLVRKEDSKILRDERIQKIEANLEMELTDAVDEGYIQNAFGTIPSGQKQVEDTKPQIAGGACSWGKSAVRLKDKWPEDGDFNDFFKTAMPVFNSASDSVGLLKVKLSALDVENSSVKKAMVGPLMETVETHLAGISVQKERMQAVLAGLEGRAVDDRTLAKDALKLLQDFPSACVHACCNLWRFTTYLFIYIYLC